MWILPILCTRANKHHCTSTFKLERSVKRCMRLCKQMLANTGSTIPGVRHRPASHLHCPSWLSAHRSGLAARYQLERKDACVTRLACSNSATSNDKPRNLARGHGRYHKYDGGWVDCGHGIPVLFPVDKDTPACFHHMRNHLQRKNLVWHLVAARCGRHP